MHSGSASIPQVKETKTPLANALSLVMAYADAWRPGGFPVPVEQEADISQANDSAAPTAANSKERRMPPKHFLLHRAVWAQAEILAKRCQLLSRVGQDLSAEVRRQSDLVRKPLLDAKRSITATHLLHSIGQNFAAEPTGCRR